MIPRKPNHKDTKTLIYFFLFCVFVSLWLVLRLDLTASASVQTPAPKLEGCVSCHGLIEPMHKYGTTETLDKLKDGKDAHGVELYGMSRRESCAAEDER